MCKGFSIVEEESASSEGSYAFFKDSAGAIHDASVVLDVPVIMIIIINNYFYIHKSIITLNGSHARDNIHEF